MTESDQEETDFISLLPAEVFHDGLFPYLDVFSLISLGATCEYLHFLVNADVTWRSRIQAKFGTLPNEAEVINRWDGNYKSWFLEHPCLRFDGVYISRCVYYRNVRPTGNIHLTDEERRARRDEPPVLPICYFRYLMFIPNTQRCLCMRSEASNQEAVKVLQSCCAKLQQLPSKKLASLETDDLETNSASSEETRRLLNQVVLAEWSFQPSMEDLMDGEPAAALDPTSSSVGILSLTYFERSNFNWTRYLNEARLVLSHRRVEDHETRSVFKRFNSKLDWLSFSITTAGQMDRRHSLSLNSTHFKPFIFYRARSLAHNF